MPTPFPTQFTTRTPVSTDNHDIRIAKGEARQLALEQDFSLLLAGIPGIANLTQFVNDTVAASNLYVTLASGPYLTTADAAATYAPLTAFTFDGYGNLSFSAFDGNVPEKVGFILPHRDCSNLLVASPSEGALVWDTSEKSVKVAHSAPLQTPAFLKVITATPSDIVVDSGPAYTVLPSDNGRTVILSDANPVVVTLAADLLVTQQVGFTCKFIQTGVGQVSFLAGNGVTINSVSGNLKISARYGVATIHVISQDVINLDGNLTA